MCRILIIDDDNLIRWSLKEMLSRKDYSVDTAANAWDALRLCEERKYSLILSDIELGEEGGIETLKKVRLRQPQAQIIILTARPRQEIEGHLGDVDPMAFLDKPFRADQINTLVDGALNKGNPVPKEDNHIDKNHKKEV